MPLSQVDPGAYQSLLQAKCDRTSALLAPFAPPPARIYASSPTGFRMRAEFRIWHTGDELDYVMFHPEDRATPVAIDQFPIACERIQRLMPRLRALLKANPELRRKLFQVEFLSTLAGDTLVTLIYHRRLDEQWDAEAAGLAQTLEVSLVGRSRGQKRVIGRDFVRELLPVENRELSYVQYEQSFTQPNAGVNISMLGWACERAAGLEGDLLELYCGNGNFTLALAPHFDQVIATELAKTSVRAARENIRANAVGNVQVIRLSAAEVAEAMAGERIFRRLADLPKALPEYDLRTLFVDPPRAGLDEDTLAMATTFEAVIYVSCNPDTLARNLQQLSMTHDIVDFALFDQFPYTHHMECGVLLLKRDH